VCGRAARDLPQSLFDRDAERQDLSRRTKLDDCDCVEGRLGATAIHVFKVPLGTYAAVKRGMRMQLSYLDSIFSPLDLVALVFFLICMVGYSMFTGVSRATRNSLSGAIQAQRVAWLLNMSRRDNRTLDAILLGSLGQGNAFFASSSAIAIGGLAAMLGSGEKVQQMLERIPYVAPSTGVVWELKLILIIGVFVYAFFKFAWAFRLSHYTAIMIGSTPLLNDTNVAKCDEHAARTAQLAGLSAEHSNGGIRAFYYAIAAMSWFAHPILFIGATAWILVILVRRDYFSRSLALISGRGKL
jgi:uncharacterized membrane protein